MAAPNLVTTPWAHHEQIIVGLDPGVLVSPDLCVGQIPSVANMFADLAVRSVAGMSPKELVELADMARRDAYRVLEDGVSVGSFLIGLSGLFPGHEPHIETFDGQVIRPRRVMASTPRIDTLNTRKLFR